MNVKCNNEEHRCVLQAAADGDINYIKKVPHELLKLARCSSGCTALHWAAGSGHTKILEYLLTDPKLLIPIDTLANKKAKGRTALHYSCRNGFLRTSQYLVEMGANVDAKAKHGVTPFQLAIWQNHLPICQWLVSQDVDAAQVNDFDCGAVHWLGLSPLKLQSKCIIENETNYKSNLNEEILLQKGKEENIFQHQHNNNNLIPLARWLAKQKNINFHLKQRQGHTPMHKAAWGGHLALIQYLHEEHGLMDNVQDRAGNYAADLADMANTSRHSVIAKYLRDHCSEDRIKSCQILGVDVDATKPEIRKAFLAKIRLVHPDKKHFEGKEQDLCCSDTQHDPFKHIDDNAIKRDKGSEWNFDDVKKAYDHLMIQNGAGRQSNPSHSINLMLAMTSQRDQCQNYFEENTTKDDLFKARLVAVLLEYGDEGIALCNVKKKWKQVWPNIEFPSSDLKKKKGSLAYFIEAFAGDVAEIRNHENGKGCFVYPKHCRKKNLSNYALS